MRGALELSGLGCKKSDSEPCREEEAEQEAHDGYACCGCCGYPCVRIGIVAERIVPGDGIVA